MSISHALAAAEAIRARLNTAEHAEHQATTPAEISEGRAARLKVIQAIRSSINMVTETIGVLEISDPKPKQAATLTAKVFPKHQKTPPMKLSSRAPAVAMLHNAAGADAIMDQSPQDKLRDSMKGSGLAAGVKSLTQMADAVAPIVDNFNSVLDQPFLDQYNATLNTVPLVGLQGNQIWFIDTKQDAFGGKNGTKDVWSVFSSLPDGAVISPGDKVFMFPYKGDFCLSIGRSVWIKARRNKDDPALTAAVDNWPNMYVNAWVKVENVLPAVELAGIIPFAVLSADRESIEFHLVLLKTDGTLLVLAGDSLAPESTYNTLHYAISDGSPATSPKWNKIAYWNNQVVAVDGESKAWNLQPNFADSTYTASDSESIEPVTEFTANDGGPVGLRSDGNLWRRIIEAPSAQGQDPNQLWKPWIKADGRTNIGVASPGVILDLSLLTKTLKGRYMDVQSKVYPVVNTIRAFSTTHVFYLKGVLKDADDFSKAGSDPDKQALAIKSAKKFIAHSKTWGMIVSRSVNGVKEGVNIMTKQLNDVKSQLIIQLKLLEAKLVGLEKTLDEQQQSMSKLKAAFWGMVAMAIVSLVVAVALVATGNFALAAGAGLLMIGGIVAAATLGKKIADLAHEIATTESQISTVKTAMAELGIIVAAFNNLDDMYGTLNGFWGGVMNDVSAIKDMDNATAIQLGYGILEDISSIEASLDMTNNMNAACSRYLEVLNRQGIQIPVNNGAAALTIFATSSGDCPLPVKPSAQALDEQFHQTVQVAREMLKKRDDVAYEKIMAHAVTLNTASITAANHDKIATGIWFDIPALRNSASTFGGGISSFTRSIGFPSLFNAGVASGVANNSNTLNGSLNEVRPLVKSTLEGVINLAQVMVAWSDKYPTLPKDITEAANMRARALEVCSEAQNNAALTNNKFADFNGKAQDFSHQIEQSIGTINTQIDARQKQADAELSSVSAPWWLSLGGFFTVLAWEESKKSDIRNDRDAAIRDLKSDIDNLTNTLNSGLSFHGQSQSWVNMAAEISGDLGSIYNDLSGISGQLLEDPALYADLMKIEWKTIAAHANEVLQILGSGLLLSVATVLSASATRDAAQETSVKDSLLRSVIPKKGLGKRVRGQSNDAQLVFEKLETLLTMPYARDIVGYWDDGNTERKTLFDVVTSLRSEYVHMVATEYETIQQLYNLSILQEYRSKNVAQGKLPLQIFVQNTLNSVRAALQAANNTNTRFGNSSKQFDFILSVIEKNIRDIETRLVKVNDDIKTSEGKLRDAVIWVVADVIALSLATAALLATFGVFGPVASAVALATQIGFGAAMTAAAVKIVLDSMTVSELAATISSLQGLRDTLQSSLANLREVQPLFQGVVTGVKDLKSTIEDMTKRLEDTSANASLIEHISLTKTDAETIRKAWTDVRNDTQSWMEVINRQGISPITFSIKSA